ncbi:MAG TPA: nuclear transport factor 2 family protein [Anaerolineales bacterium]|nr:nuclear transport factor 2 family protein [Anaerolineales bacterium]
MTRIICAEDCGNSPKKLLLKGFNVALARGNQAAVLKRLTDDILWEWVGSAPLRGREAVASMLRRMHQEPRQELVIDHILTHGDAGSVNGTLRLTNGRSYGFCHVFVLSGAGGKQIRRITSYEIRN